MHDLDEVVVKLEKTIVLHTYEGSEITFNGNLESIREQIACEVDENLKMKHRQALQCCIDKLKYLGWYIDYHVAFGNHITRR